MAINRGLVVLCGLLAVAGAACNPGCSGPRPTITVGQENRQRNGPPRVRATIVPNQFQVTEVILEFGRRPSSANAVAIQYDSTPSSYDLTRTLTRTLPTTQAFDISFYFPIGGDNPLQVGEIIDYQFRVTHLNENNSPLFFWSGRRTFEIGPDAGGGGGGIGGGGAGGGIPCEDVFRLVSGDGASGGGSVGVVSADGAFVAFVTGAALDPQDTNGANDVYRREFSSGNVTRVTGLASVPDDLGGTQPAISADGRFIAFTTRSNFDAQDTNGVEDVYRRDMSANGEGAFVRISGLASVPNDLGGNQPAISGNGRFVAFTTRSNFVAQDTNGVEDVYRRDADGAAAAAFARVSGLASVPSDEGGTQPTISADGRFIAFSSRSNFDSDDTNGVDDVYRRDMNGAGAASFARVSELESVASDQGGTQPAISADGRFVAFTSRSNFDANDTNDADDVYRRDMTSATAGAFARVTGLASVPSDQGGKEPSITGDGRFVAFTTSSNFDANDTNGTDDVYRRDMDAAGAGAFFRISGLASAPTDLGARFPSISRDNGRTVVFTSRTTFEADDTNGADDVYRRTVCAG